MGGKWVNKRLGEIITLQRGYDLPSQVRRSGNVPIMGSAGVTGFHDTVKVNGPGVVVGRSGNSMGEVHYTNENYWPLNTCLYVTDFKGNDEQFIYYLLKTINFDQFNSGSAQKSLNRNAVYPLEVRLPESIKEQRKIAKVLGALESKITLNCQITQTLEAIAQAVFKSWFIDFEPVKAKINAVVNDQDPALAAIKAISGKSEAEIKELQIENAEAYQQLYNIVALFPQELQESELGLIPLGWRIVKLIEVVTELRRGISPKYTEDGGVLVINQKCIRNHSIDYSLCRRHNDAIKNVDGKEIKVGDVLINSTGVGTLGRLSIVKYLPETTVVDSHVTVVRADNKSINPSFLGSLLLTKEAMIEASGAGSTGQTELRRQVLEEINLIIPETRIQEAFEKQYLPIIDLIAENEKQQGVLISLRDTLLPKLLSGDLTLKETEALFED